MPRFTGYLWPSPWHLSLGSILLLGLTIRLAVFWLLPDQGFPDAMAYRESGESLLSTGLVDAVEYMPLYPVWTYLWGGGIGLKLADVFLSVATIWVVHRLAMDIFDNNRVAVIAALCTAIYPHFLFYAVSGLTETAYLLLVCTAYSLMYRERYWTSAAVIVLSILVKPTLDLLAPLLIIVFVVIVHRHSAVHAAMRVGAYVLVYLVLMAPWWVHNYEKYGEFVRLNLGDGIVLYSGNNPLNKSGGGVNYSPGDEGYEEYAVDRDMGRFKSIEDRVERNDALRRAAYDYIIKNPSHFVELAGVKFIRFWRLWPYAPKYEKPHLIAASLLSYGVVLGLSLWFVLQFTRKHWRVVAPLYLFATYLTAVHMATIGSIRYRLPLEPFMIVLASYTMNHLLERCRWAQSFLPFIGNRAN